MKELANTFDVDLACKYGVDEAIFINLLEILISINKENDSNGEYVQRFADGYEYICYYATLEELKEHLRYWSTTHINEIINSLAAKAAIVVARNINAKDVKPNNIWMTFDYYKLVY